MLDAINRLLLEELHRDPRMTMSALARRVGMSSPAVTERVQRMERTGVIRGFRMDVDPAAIGVPVAAWVRIRPGPGQLPKIVELMADMPNVSEGHRISGEDCFLVKVHAAAIEDLEQVLDRFLLFGQTITSILVSSPCRRDHYQWLDSTSSQAICRTRTWADQNVRAQGRCRLRRT